MCQIFFCVSQAPEIPLLVEANKCNPHGIGYAWSENGRVHWKKGFSKEQADTVYEDFLSKPFPKAIHFRLATHGGRSPEMTHPFNITKQSAPSLQGTSNAVLFHNGVWTDFAGVLTKGIVAGTISKKVLSTPMSDSRAMAVLAGNFGEEILDLMNLTGEKVLILKPNGDYISYGYWYDGVEDADKNVLWFHSNRHLNRASKEKAKTKSKWQNKRNDTVVLGTADLTSEVTKQIPFESGAYLSQDREEVEASLLQWEGHGNDY